MSKKKELDDQKDKFEYGGFTITHNHKIEDRKFINHMVGTKPIKTKRENTSKSKLKLRDIVMKKQNKRFVKKSTQLTNQINTPITD